MPFASYISPLAIEGATNQPSFHVVVLGLPGYGFSEAPSTQGFDIAQYAEVGNKLMLALGYNEYVTQGGDWGFMVCFIAKAVSVMEPRPTIPLGLSHFPKELMMFPKSWSRGLGHIVFEADHKSGGHFAAYEQPEALADDLRKMFGKGGPAFGVVPGGSGYA
ncbi:Alpha/Beta hydrolase protein [Mycena epipterygia]|nr:Alpha/Beta hydrolase protein [Mycena epipterygia]